MKFEKKESNVSGMLEHLSQRARFRQWLQEVAAGNVSDYPEPSDLPEDARTMLESDDSVRRELRQMRNDVGVLRKRLAELAEADAARDDEELIRQLADRLREARRSTMTAEIREVRSTGELQEALDTAQRDLDHARDRVAHLEAELAQAQRSMDREQQKLLPVVRYAYRLRRLLQHIFHEGELTEEHRSHIVELLKAGGVPVDSDRQEVTRN
jgi:chromosome segregation ATPase